VIVRVTQKHQSGVTLIELMVALVLGLLVAAGIVTVFMSTSSSNRAQTQLARLQEEGRFAINRLTSDMQMANAQYCTNTGGVAKATNSGTYVDGLRASMVYAKSLTAALSDNTTTMGSGSYPGVPTSPYAFPSFLSMRGYDCDSSTCTPVKPETGTTLPAMGKAVGSRVIGADVLTLRYLDSSGGWAVTGGAGTSITASGGSISSITLVPASNESTAAAFKSGDLAMVADCSGSQIFAASIASGVITPDGTNNLGTPASQQPMSAARVFDFNKSYQTVTYYLAVVDNGNGQTTGALIRRLNGVDQELVRGIERMDFLYGVEDSNGNTRYLTADKVDAGTACTTAAPGVLSSDPGCMWRSVKSIEVNVLMDGQIPLYTLLSSDMQYSYGSDATTTALAAPSGHAITPSAQGFPDQMLRREFSALVSVRNFNP